MGIPVASSSGRYYLKYLTIARSKSYNYTRRGLGSSRRKLRGIVGYLLYTIKGLYY